MKPTLLVMAAGMGSRFGGLKQIRPFGPNGEIIIDYTLYDAIMAGFGKIVFVIKKEMEADFKEIIMSHRFANDIKIELAFQCLDDLPDGFSPPIERTKPWGTAHAVYSARDRISEPFGIVGADDFFGRDTIMQLGTFLSESCRTGEGCMVGFALRGTASENGSVSRGVCEVKDNKLMSVTERTDLTLSGDSALYTGENGEKVAIPADSTVSMNVWGFDSSIYSELKPRFSNWLKDNSGEMKKEYYLPSFVDELVKEKKLTVNMRHTTSRWYGVTYGSDAEVLENALRAMHEGGEYPRLR